MNEKIAAKMDSFEIKERVAKVRLATNPIEYLVEAIDQLAQAEDQPSDIDIAVELLSEIETDLQLVANDSSLVVHNDIDVLLKYGLNSEIGLKVLYTLFKEVGFTKDAMLTAVEVNSDSAFTRVNNLDNLKIIREIYGE